MAFGLITKPSSESMVCNWPILLKKSTMVSTVEKYALEIEIFTLSRGIQESRLRFRVAARKKGVFSGQYAGSLEEPTFSTESADFCLSPPPAFGTISAILRQRFRLCENAKKASSHQRPRLFGAFGFVRATDEKGLSAHQRHQLAGLSTLIASE